MSVQPFTVSVPTGTLDDLRDRLSRTRWTDEVTGAGWDYGTNRDYLQALVAHWQHDFDWRAQEAAINAFAHFRADVQGTNVHFIHERGTGPNPIPLLLLHGWPGSFVQMLRIIPLLTRPPANSSDDAVSFHVVAASLPGYGFSDRPAEPGMSVARMASVFHELMTDQLGYDRFAVRGSDLGAGVLGQLALTYPGSLIGTHQGGTNPWFGDVPDDLSAAEQAFVANAQRWSQEEMGYAMEQSSRPQSLAYALNDSHAGLAAWIVEKFRRWSDCDGDVEHVFGKDDLLTNLTIYWATETIGSSIRLYYESARNPGAWGQADVPNAMAMPPDDMFPTPREWAEHSTRIDRWTELSRGGHFPEWEVPEELAADIRAFFGGLR